MFEISRVFRKESESQIIYEKILKPLCEAYERAKKDERMVLYDENTITRRLVWHLRHSVSLCYSYRKKTICIEMRPQELYAEDYIYKPDIKIMVGDLWMEIESKRIHKGNHWSVAEYLNRERGVGRFVWGVYSHNENHGGMIGYIQKGDFYSIIQKIRTGLEKMNCKKCEDIREIKNCILSIHIRSGKEDIKIYHLFFYFS